MAVKAKYPSNALQPSETSTSSESKRMKTSLDGQGNLADDRTPAMMMMHVPTQDCRMLQAVSGSAQRPSLYAFRGPVMQAVPAADTELNVDVNIWNQSNNITENTARKRLRGGSTSREVLLDNHNVATALNMQPTTASTGAQLRLSLEDVKATNCAAEMDRNYLLLPKASNTNNVASSSLAHSFATEIQRQRSDMDDFVKLETERLKQMLHEKTERHSEALVFSVAKSVTCKLREKELQVMCVKQRNMELEQHMRSLFLESQMWQSRAKSSEEVARALKMLIQQNSNEGSGDSEEELWLSKRKTTTVNGNANTNNNNNFGTRSSTSEGKCRLCNSSYVSILLWPCRHLCLCEACQNNVEFCPVCASQVNRKVKVYLS